MSDYNENDLLPKASIQRLMWNSIYLPSIKYIDDSGKMYYMKKIHRVDFNNKLPINILYVLGLDVKQPTGIKDFLIFGYIIKKSENPTNTASTFETADMVASFMQLGMQMEIWVYKPHSEMLDITLPPKIDITHLESWIDDPNEEYGRDNRHTDD